MKDRPSEQDDLETVSAWMRQFAAEQLDGRPLGDPSILWWKGQLLRRWDAERQAAAPVEIGERVQIGIGGFGGLAALAWLWPALGVSAHESWLTGVVVLTSVLLVTLATISAWDVLKHE